MATPSGDITTSNIWSGKPLEDGEKNYKVTFTRNSVKSTVVTASSEEEALMKAQFRVSGNENEYDELVQEFEPEIKEQK
jgi:hypothetical protein